MSAKTDRQILETVSRFHGYDKEDLALAREIAKAVMPNYGDLTGEAWDRWRENPWNDHISIQAALAAVRYVKAAQRGGLTSAAADVLAERARHQSGEGWTAAHDDQQCDGEMALAAGAYCESAARPTLMARKPGAAYAIPKLWPRSWDVRRWWKPKNPRRDLVRAGALILAEIERLDRLESSTNG